MSKYAVIGHHYWGRPGGGQLICAATAVALEPAGYLPVLTSPVDFNGGKYVDRFGIDLSKLKPSEERKDLVAMLGRFSGERMYHWVVSELYPKLRKEPPEVKIAIFKGTGTIDTLALHKPVIAPNHDAFELYRGRIITFNLLNPIESIKEAIPKLIKENIRIIAQNNAYRYAKLISFDNVAYLHKLLYIEILEN